MTRDFATDPEVAEDLIHRARSERDRDRTGEFTFGDATVVESWPCRTRCGEMVGVTAAAIFAFDTNNRRLEKLRERPMGKHEVMWCPDCKRLDDEERAAARRLHEQTEIASTPAEERPSWMPTPNPKYRRRNT